MEPFQKNNLGAPYSLKFNKIYEHLENVENNSQVNTESAVDSEKNNKDNKDVKDVKDIVSKTPEEIRKLSEELIKETKKEELKKQEEEKKELEKPKEEPKKDMFENLWFYLGIAMTLGVILALVYYFVFRNKSNKTINTKPIITNMKYSLTSPSSTPYQSSEYFPNSLRNLKNIVKK